jgi:hypothetical protein
MIFGAHVRSAASIAPAQWIAGACLGEWGTVGALVPNQYPLVLRLRAPDSGIPDWWAAYRDLFGIVASVGKRHTASPDRAWFAVWDGHGFANARTYVSRSPLDNERSRTLDPERSRLRDDDERRNTAIRSELRQVPRFELPDRTYYLLAGALSAATRLARPGSTVDWQHPDLIWPDDRRWFVATDIDIWSLYVGGDHDFIAELSRIVPTLSELAAFDLRLAEED